MELENFRKDQKRLLRRGSIGVSDALEDFVKREPCDLGMTIGFGCSGNEEQRESVYTDKPMFPTNSY